LGLVLKVFCSQSLSLANFEPIFDLKPYAQEKGDRAGNSRQEKPVVAADPIKIGGDSGKDHGQDLKETYHN